MFWKKKRNILNQIPKEIQDAAKKTGMPYVGVGYCRKCGHTRWNTSSFDGPKELPCPRCQELGAFSEIIFTYTKI